MSFEDFLRKFHPHVFTEYERSLASWDDLTPGTIVMTLRNGFATNIGGFKRVTEETKKTEHWEYKVLGSLGPAKNKLDYEDRSILMRFSADWRKEHWWQCIVAVDYESIISLSFREQEQYIKDIIEGRRIK